MVDAGSVRFQRQRETKRKRQPVGDGALHPRWWKGASEHPWCARNATGDGSRRERERLPTRIPILHWSGMELNGPDRTGSLLPSPALCPRNATQHSPSRRFVLASVGCRCALLCSASALTPKPCETDFPANRSTPTRRKRNPLFVCLIVCLIRSVELTHQTLFRLLLCRLLEV